MRIGGIQKYSTIDFPKKLACVLFTQGCHFRCGFCHNAELVEPKQFGNCLAEEEVFTFLEKRRKALDGVVISGGEPTLHPDLETWLRRIRDLGFATKLDTNGIHPNVLQSLIQGELLDFVAMDIKHCLQASYYDSISGISPNLESIQESVQTLLSGSVDYEFRTTLISEIHRREDMLAIAASLRGARQWTIQSFRPQKTLNPQWQNFRPWSAEAIGSLRTELAEKFPELRIRYLGFSS
ncbi:MAG: anaerobic ribonucleoside-triphosphate reductase activating protein [Puniceicoccales bacterium]|jgi:pyruvate formate lyase activating enzyme|nr:anaerobic ribonucleoside-triphosphate reductase activating protein [Puniceicoccales bacterium]